MFSARATVTVFALYLAAGTFSVAQSIPNDPLNEKIRQADALQDKGSLQEAQAAYESVLKSLSPDTPSQQLGHVLNGLSNVASSLGKNSEAVDFAQRALGAYHALGDAEGQSYALNSRGIAEGELGQYSAAQASFNDALSFSRSIKDLKTEVRTLNNLGNAYYFPGNYLEALRAYERALQIVENHPAETWSDYWRQITKINQATLYQRLGRYQDALTIYKQVGGATSSLSASDKAHLFMNLGVLYRRLGDPWKALDSYQSALDLYTQQHDDDGDISVLKNMGIVYALDQNDLKKARHFFEKALARAQSAHMELEVVQTHLYLGETLLRESDLQSARPEFEAALAQAERLGIAEEQWKAHYAIGKINELSGHAADAQADYEMAIAIIEMSRSQLQLSALRAEFLIDKRDAYDALIALLLSRNDIRSAFTVLEKSRARTFQDRLAAGRGRDSKHSGALSLGETQRYLDSDTVLLEYWVSGNRVALLWCTHDSHGVKQITYSTAEREHLLEFLRQLPDSLKDDWRQQVSTLGSLFPDASSLPPNLRHVVIVPDGWLAAVPFDLAPASPHSDTLLIEKYDISYLPTATLFRRAPATRAGLHFPWMPEFAAFGNPAIEIQERGQRTFEKSGSLARLPYSEEEIASISRMARGRSEMHLGSADIKRAFLASQGPRAPLLHVSTHAFADADIPENSRILFSPADPAGSADYVFLRELYDLDLHDVNLATLSACNTERGKMIRGEGVQAFSRALLVAGSRSSLTTLWRVADQPTSEFMKQFYYYALVKRQSKVEALRSAKLTFINSNTQLANPAHWAAFVLNGDGTGTLPRFVSWGELMSMVTIATLVLGAGIWFLLQSRRRVNRVHSSERVVSQ
ncbi:MAG: CHAT domain-containing protein [Acidobacteria bacterium]|nr:CHAT domain-containing protein [Acidobacteriota bacterium]